MVCKMITVFFLAIYFQLKLKISDIRYIKIECLLDHKSTNIQHRYRSCFLIAEESTKFITIGR